MRKILTAALVAGLGVSCAGFPAQATNEAAPGTPQGQAEAKRLATLPPVGPPRGNRITDDRSGRKQTGKASVYSHRFSGKKMANGRKFSPHGNAAASKSLPLGTTAKVTNLENGRSGVVSVEDRGPHVSGRIMDLSPKSAEQIGLDKKEGVAPVEVAPIAVPQKDGGVKAGAGAADTP